VDLIATSATDGAIKQRVADELEAARRRSRDLLAPLDDDVLVRQHSPLMSPLVWDFAHIGNYEELWLLRAVSDHAPLRPEIDDLYDAFKHPRKDRPSLPLLGPVEASRYVDEVRARALDVLDKVELHGDRPLLDRAFVYGMVVQHEHQHDETMLATLQLMGSVYSPAAVDVLPTRAPVPVVDEVLVPAGPFTMGAADTEAWAYDNERPAHVVDLPAYWIDATPVTNDAYAQFIGEGGYADPRWWSDEGWAWRCETGAVAPLHWVRDEEGRRWLRDRFGYVEPLPSEEPVAHVCWHEAQAYARWAGKRLPTEAEWEKAAAFDPATGRSRRYPWGDAEPTDDTANLGQQIWRPTDVGSYPDGVSALGCHQMLGDVWEWTASDFTAYGGFRVFPYAEYSAVFFGSDYKVLRGGSWATSPRAIRNSFRNWDYPIRRQIFSGFRCARDADV
jgi:iron(II)-dependent oxidoreductase